MLNQRRLGVDLAARALDAQVGLIRALGGGYRADAPSRPRRPINRRKNDHEQRNTRRRPPSLPAIRKRKKALTCARRRRGRSRALAWGAYEWLVASHYESTDNAYVQGNVIQITPQIGGTVMAIYADDTDFVKAGQPLVQLDPADAKVALEQAEANLAQTVRQVRTLYANNGSLAAQVTSAPGRHRQGAVRRRARQRRPEPRASRWRATARCRRKNSTMR